MKNRIYPAILVLTTLVLMVGCLLQKDESVSVPASQDEHSRQAPTWHNLPQSQILPPEIYNGVEIHNGPELGAGPEVYTGTEMHHGSESSGGGELFLEQFATHICQISIECYPGSYENMNSCLGELMSGFNVTGCTYQSGSGSECLGLLASANCQSNYPDVCDLAFECK